MGDFSLISVEADLIHIVWEIHVFICCCMLPLQLDYTPVNEKWALSDVKAVFSRRYLHQNKALEIFFSNRC